MSQLLQMSQLQMSQLRRLPFFCLIELALLLGLGVLLGPLQAGADLGPPSEVLSVEWASAQPLSGATAQTSLQLRFQLQTGYHAYLDQFDFEMLEPDEVEVRIQGIQPIVDFYDRFSKKNRQGVEGNGQIELILNDSRPRFANQMKGVLLITYQACSKERCFLPRKIKVPIEWPVKSAEVSPLLPANPSSFAFWLSVFVAGVLTSLTPCVFPLIPITIAVLGSRRPSGGRFKGLFMSLVYVLGIATTYSFMGVVAASTGALFGQFLGHPLVAIALAIFFVYLALAMIDVVQLQTPLALVRRFHLPQTQGGAFGAYLAGLLAGIIASPCVGPVLAAILTFVAQTQNLLFGFGLLFTFAFGMGQLFLALGTFSSLRDRLPKSGPWMNVIKYVFALTFVGLAIFYLQPVAKKYWFSSKVQSVKSTTSNQKADGTGPRDDVGTGDGVGVKGDVWRNYDEKLETRALEDGKPVVIDFYADWCTACKEMEEKTFPVAVPDFAAQVVFLRFDATNESAEFNKLKNRFGIVGLPHFVFLDPRQGERKDLTLTGFEGPTEFAARLKALIKKP